MRKVTRVNARVKVLPINVSKEFGLKVTSTPSTIELEITDKVSILVDRSELLEALDAPVSIPPPKELNP